MAFSNRDVQTVHQTTRIPRAICILPMIFLRLLLFLQFGDSVQTAIEKSKKLELTAMKKI